MQKIYQFYTDPKITISHLIEGVNEDLSKGWILKNLVNTVLGESILTQIVLEKLDAKGLASEKEDIVKSAERLSKVTTFGSKYGSGVGTLEDIASKFPIGG